MKRAQMEILGLAIVIVLLTLVGLIALKFFLNKEPTETRKEFVQSETASSFLSTLLKTSSGCKKTSFEELLQDCAGLKTIQCNNPFDPCEYAKARIKEVLQKSLKDRGKDYEFTLEASVTTSTLNFKIKKYGERQEFCDSNHKTKAWPLPLKQGTLIVRLDICD